MGIRQYLSIATATVILLTSGFVAGYLYIFIRNSTIADVRGALEILVSSGALMIAGEDIAELSSKGDFEKSSYARVYGVLRQLTVVNASKGFRENSIYVLKPAPNNEEMIFAAHLPGNSNTAYHIGEIQDMADPVRNYIGNKYHMTAVMREIMSDRRAFGSTDIYTDMYGTWVSAYAPIRTKSGKITGILEADYEVHALTARINQEFVYVGVAVMLSALFGIGLMVMLSRRISRPIQILADAVDRIAHGDFKTGIEFRRGDEIGYLGDHINSMAVSLAEKLRLSRYVSAETMQRVAGSLDSEHSAERARIACMFADVRGFTRYSDGRDPAHVIRVLNELFATEASCVNLFAGSIDKFIGDEIMVTFDGEDASARAIRSAIHIKEATEQLCSREGFSIGIGIHEGEVIRGDLGSSTRKDYTVIGSTVNLASRLCGAAKGGQILISEEVYRLTSSGFQTTRLGRAKVKGFLDLISIYNVTENGKQAA